MKPSGPARVHTEIRFAGVGGQGNILAGDWVAEAAHSMGMHAVQSPTYTAQVRGGPTSVDIVIDSVHVEYPRLTAVDFLLCLAQGAWDAFARQLKPDSIIVISPKLVKRVGPGPQKIYRVPIVDLTKKHIGKMVYTSAVSLGIFCRLHPVIPREVMQQTIAANAPGGTVATNLDAFKLGWDVVEDVEPVPRDELAQLEAEETA